MRITILAYLRSMWSILWTSFRYPRTTTLIDLSTGEWRNMSMDEASKIRVTYRFDGDLEPMPYSLDEEVNP